MAGEDSSPNPRNFQLRLAVWSYLGRVNLKGKSVSDEERAGGGKLGLSLEDLGGLFVYQETAVITESG